ncbi:MAG: hypothetical protein LBH29_03130, partial [Elusimicrobiota bacterium]|nr:hypothetical protein [Elusimicrobiota bacterium]
MPVIFDPSRIVNKVLPHNAGDLVTKDLNFKQKFKTALSRLDWLSDRDIIKSIDKSMSFYRKKAKELQLEGEKPAEAKADALNGGKLLNARLSDLIVSKASEDVKEKYSGQKY